ncbi:sulfatase-like hydrolase/transferase [Dyadobacter frigoris]|uniref:Sulfatase n=1 Tax=Dyadobacter frigoris TaxID=2576211 RepID=A0A4U6CYG2_9BACT|nr:sulfatase-like hydrolase/transferase [Dyadobacter frigoris]TKT88791.1 sulfatase [Dyadobacter frigoris]GLU53988.1 sulfatase [Dyadobacter frigoris]
MALTVRRRVILFSSLILISGSAAYLFWPLTSDEFDIIPDKEKIAEKQQFLAEAPTNKDHDKPNIIVLIADDLGKTDLPLYGNKVVEAPNINALASEGAVFNEAYVSAPICSPSRAGLLTGRYQQRFGYELQPVNRYLSNRITKLIVNNTFDLQELEFADLQKVPDQAAIAKQGLPVQEITIADLLKKNGYQTGIIGKWHQGYSEEFLPLKRGFDYHYGFYEAFSWFADTSETVNSRNKGIMDSHIWEQGNSGPALKRRNNDVIKVEEFYTYALAREANQFIEKNKEKPFFLYVPFNAPHTPFQALTKDVNKYKAKGVTDLNKAIYYSLITGLDSAVGQIHDKIKALGLEENTLIFFLSDNGGATYTNATNNAPLRGGKMSLYEGGINVPFVVKWKGKIDPGLIVNSPVSSLDIFATAASVSGSTLPASRSYDGVNLIPYLNNTNKELPHQTLYWRSGMNKAIRKGEWKLVLNNKDNLTLLFNLKADKSELNNLAQRNPTKVSELKNDLAAWEKNLIKPLWPGSGYYKNDYNGKPDRFSL